MNQTSLILAVCLFLNFTFAAVIFGEDQTIYDPTKGKWVPLQLQCPRNAAGERNEPNYSYYYVRIQSQYKIYQGYTGVYTASGGYYKTSDSCRDGSIVPQSAFLNAKCLTGYSTTQCVNFPGLDVGNGSAWQGNFPIYSRCYYVANRGWTWEVRAFCTNKLAVYEWQYNDGSFPWIKDQFNQGSACEPEECCM